MFTAVYGSFCLGTGCYYGNPYSDSFYSDSDYTPTNIMLLPQRQAYCNTTVRFRHSQRHNLFIFLTLSLTLNLSLTISLAVRSVGIGTVGIALVGLGTALRLLLCMHSQAVISTSSQNSVVSLIISQFYFL